MDFRRLGIRAVIATALLSTALDSSVSRFLELPAAFAPFPYTINQFKHRPSMTSRRAPCLSMRATGWRGAFWSFSQRRLSIDAPLVDGQESTLFGSRRLANRTKIFIQRFLVPAEVTGTVLGSRRLGNISERLLVPFLTSESSLPPRN